MKKVDKIISTISFEETKKIIKFQDIYDVMMGAPEAKFSANFKKIIVLVLGLFVPMVMLVTYSVGHKNMPESNLSRTIAIITSSLIIFEILYFYFRKGYKYLNNYVYQSFIYLVGKNVCISMYCGSIGRDDGNYLLTVVPILVYIVTSLYFYYRVEKNLIFDAINQLFMKNYQTSKMLNIFLKISGIIVVLGIGLIQFYRVNKWWLRNVVVDSNTSSLLESNIGWVFAIPILMLIALIPTYLCFDAFTYVKAKLIKQYAEEFRQEYDFTKEEWYGEE